MEKPSVSVQLQYVDDASDSDSKGTIGPNSVIQLSRAIRVLGGDIVAEGVFAASGYSSLLNEPPDQMIDEAIPAQLFRTMWNTLPREQAAAIAYDAGLRTADYIIENRIPKKVRVLLRIMPTRIAMRVLLRAIEKHAWTFAGSGACSTQTSPDYLIRIKDNPLVMPECCWHRGVFERLFGMLLAANVTVNHVQCGAAGDDACLFVVHV